MSEGDELDREEPISLAELLQAPLWLGGVEIVGLGRTKREVVERMIEPVLSPLRQEGTTLELTFADVVEGVSEAVERLRETEVFKGAEAVLDRSPVSNSTDLLLRIQEKKFLQLRTGTSISSATGSEEDGGATLSGSVHLRNLLGECESIGASVAWGAGSYRKSSRTASNSIVFDISKPYPIEAISLARAKVGFWTINNEARSSYVLRATGGEVDVVSSKGLGTFTFENTWRELAELADSASIKVREEAGASLKQSLRHTLTVDRRDDPLMPSSGTFGSVETEVAGLVSGDVRFVKQQVELQVHASNAEEYVTVSGAARVGAMIPLPGEKPIRINDKFFVGGPGGGGSGGHLGLRGFRTRGIGPRQDTDALGGTGFYSGTLMASMAVPERSIFGRFFAARAHAFGSVGDLVDVGELREVASASGRGGLLERLRGGVRCSVGLGLAMSLPFGRLEVNYCQVLLAVDGDRAKRGLQVGISQQFG